MKTLFRIWFLSVITSQAHLLCGTGSFFLLQPDFAKLKENETYRTAFMENLYACVDQENVKLVTPDLDTIEVSCKSSVFSLQVELKAKEGESKEAYFQAIITFLELLIAKDFNIEMFEKDQKFLEYTGSVLTMTSTSIEHFWIMREILRINSGIKTLMLNKCTLNREIIRILDEGMKDLQLEGFGLNSVGLSTGFKDLCKVLQQQKDLYLLNLYHCDLGRQTKCTLDPIIQVLDNTRVEVLVLQRLALTDAMIEKLINHLMFSRVRILNLSENSIKHQGSMLICRLLTNNLFIEEIYLRSSFRQEDGIGNFIGVESLRLFIETLKTRKSLKVLDLRGNVDGETLEKLEDFIGRLLKNGTIATTIYVDNPLRKYRPKPVLRVEAEKLDGTEALVIFPSVGIPTKRRKTDVTTCNIWEGERQSEQLSIVAATDGVESLEEKIVQHSSSEYVPGLVLNESEAPILRSKIAEEKNTSEESSNLVLTAPLLEITESEPEIEYFVPEAQMVGDVPVLLENVSSQLLPKSGLNKSSKTRVNKSLPSGKRSARK